VLTNNALGSTTPGGPTVPVCPVRRHPFSPYLISLLGGRRLSVPNYQIDKTEPRLSCYGIFSVPCEYKISPYQSRSILSINLLNWFRRPNHEYRVQGQMQTTARTRVTEATKYLSFPFLLFLNPMLDGSICPSFFVLVAGVWQRCGNNLVLGI
jgi:hypothetical protein